MKGVEPAAHALESSAIPGKRAFDGAFLWKNTFLLVNPGGIINVYSEAWFHADRAPRRHRNYRDSRSYSFPSLRPGPRKSSASELFNSGQADGHGSNDVQPGL